MVQLENSKGTSILWLIRCRIIKWLSGDNVVIMNTIFAPNIVVDLTSRKRSCVWSCKFYAEKYFDGNKKPDILYESTNEK